MIPTSKDFLEQLDKVLMLASRQGRSHIDITAGALHRLVWGAYQRKHRLPQCCYVMKKIMREGDIIIREAEEGKEFELKIRYRLPR